MNYIGKKCPVCSIGFTADDDVVVCPKCGAPYHRSCYEKEGKCIFPDLHRSNESWVDENDDTAQEDEQKGKQCKFCGHINDENAVTCEKCGRNFVEYPYPNMHSNPPYQDPNFGGIPGFGGIPFQIDLMAGVKPDEDFDGVTGEELSKYVKNNTIYYMGIFKRIKETGKSRFNFAAFLFGGGWALFRKQYSYGVIFTLLMAIFTIVSSFVGIMYSNAILTEVTSNLNAVYTNGYTTAEFLHELAKQPIDKFILAIIPLTMSFLNFLIMLFLGFRGNRMYYKYALKQIKRIKLSQSVDIANDDLDESSTSSVDKKKLLETLVERGGTNSGIAICLLVCDMLISFIPQLFIR